MARSGGPTPTSLLPAWSRPRRPRPEAAGRAACGWRAGASFIAVFFNAALVAGAMAHLRGEHPGVAGCLRMAAARAGRILVYALISATVGLALLLP
ncbi:MAG TPA: DUF6159 family protein [Candidatus Dormibacteraeota bacterium]